MQSGTAVVDVMWKPLGRGRHFERAARGLARRLRLPFVRRTLWEMTNPTTRSGSYGVMWTSASTLSNYSFACTCHKRPRYSRKAQHEDEL